MLKDFIYSELESVDLIIKSDNNLITKDINIRNFPTYNQSILELTSLIESKTICN